MALTRAAPGDLVAVCTAGGWDDIVAAATGWSDVAIVGIQTDRIRLAFTGSVSIVVGTGEGDRRYEGTSEWTTDVIAEPCSVRVLADPGVDAFAEPGDAVAASGFRVDAGVLPATALFRRLAGRSSLPIDPFEALFGPTTARSVEDAAVRQEDAGPADHRIALGILVFSTGERVVVDEPMVLGRNPRAVTRADRTDGTDGADDADGTDRQLAHRLVRLAGASVSRQHAEIRVDRWHASIQDLGSSNGTRIRLPGRSTVPLRVGDPVDLAIGAVVELGGDVSFVVEEVA
jgi:hypothetical protein